MGTWVRESPWSRHGSLFFLRGTLFFGFGAAPWGASRPLCGPVWPCADGTPTVRQNHGAARRPRDGRHAPMHGRQPATPVSPTGRAGHGTVTPWVRREGAPTAASVAPLPVRGRRAALFVVRWAACRRGPLARARSRPVLAKKTKVGSSANYPPPLIGTPTLASRPPHLQHAGGRHRVGKDAWGVVQRRCSGAVRALFGPRAPRSGEGQKGGRHNSGSLRPFLHSTHNSDTLRSVKNEKKEA